MEYKVLLDKNADIREVEAEEHHRFVMSIVEALEVPFQWNANEPFTIEEKLKLRKALDQYNIAVIGDMDGGVQIFMERNKIAEFYKPRYVLKSDASEVDPRKRLYTEMTCVFDSVFEQEVQNES